MRKNLLILGSLVFSLCLDAQVLTFVGNDATLTVKDGALVYSGGGWQNDGNGKVNNEGDIMVVGASGTDKFLVASNADFRLKYVNSNAYGQLYISGLSQGDITGKVNKEFQADFNHSSGANLGRQQVALPFYEFTVADLKAAIEPGLHTTTGSWLNTTATSLNYVGRFNVASVFKYNNGRARYDQITGTSTVMGVPTSYYIIPRRSQSADGTTTYEEWNAATGIKTFAGRPASDEDSNASVSLTGAAAGIDFGHNGNAKNYFYERYNSYIVDPFRTGGGTTGTPAWEADYGKNLYQFANPFLTNIDLKNIGHNEGTGGDGIALAGLVGVATFKANSINWQNGIGSTYPANGMYKATTSGGVLQAGDTEALLIKPMGEFYLKMSTSGSPATAFKMQNTRWFAQASRTATNYSVSGKSANIPADKIVKQVAVVLKDGAGEELARTYYAVSPSAFTGLMENADLQAYVINYPIYTKEELASGGEDMNAQADLYINAANETDFAHKEIPLRIAPDTEATAIAFEVYEAGARLQDGEALSSGKSFYIKVNNEVTKIADGLSIPLTPATFGLFYDEPEAFLANANAINNQTIVAKKDKDWVIRFAKNWKTADVEVYSATGQLVHSKKNVSTGQDYIIPLGTQISGLFVVRTVSDAGVVVTKKIIK